MKLTTEKACWLIAAFILIGTVWTSYAKAETAIHAGGLSYHVATGHKYDYNDFHRVAAVEHDSLLAGYFRNSYDRDTFILGHGWSKQWGDFRGSVYVVLTYGYRSCFGDDGDRALFCPAAIPALHYTKYDVQPGVIVFGEAVALSVRIEL